MARIPRKTQKIFAGSASNNGQFGSAQTGAKLLTNDLATLQALAAFLTGWNDATISGQRLPTLEEMQALHYITTTQISYLFQEGIPAWDAGTNYFTNSIVKKAGTYELYGSIINDNLNNALPVQVDDANWEYLGALGGGITGFLPLGGGNMTGAINESKGANIASAGTTNIDAMTGNYGHITGTTTITSFGTASQAGVRRTLEFDGILTLTNGANLVLPGGANIVTAAGDKAEFVADTTTKWVCVSYTKISGAPVAGSGVVIVRTVYTGNATWNKNANLLYADVEVQGGAGGTGGCNTTTNSSGASAGGYSRKVIAAGALGSTESVVVGPGGTAGTNAPGDGVAGSTSSFGSHCSATGGGKSYASTGANMPDAPGVGSGGDINLRGGYGDVTTGSALAAAGGSSFFGGAGGARNTGGTGIAPQANSGSAAGGSNFNPSTARTGVAGADGIVIVTEYRSA
jgi:hypothetical protein